LVGRQSLVNIKRHAGWFTSSLVNTLRYRLVSGELLAIIVGYTRWRWLLTLATVTLRYRSYYATLLPLLRHWLGPLITPLVTPVVY